MKCLKNASIPCGEFPGFDGLGSAVDGRAFGTNLYWFLGGCSSGGTSHRFTIPRSVSPFKQRSIQINQWAHVVTLKRLPNRGTQNGIRSDTVKGRKPELPVSTSLACCTLEVFQAAGRGRDDQHPQAL